jgi:hypothetical protein
MGIAVIGDGVHAWHVVRICTRAADELHEAIGSQLTPDLQAHQVLAWLDRVGRLHDLPL